MCPCLGADPITLTVIVFSFFVIHSPSPTQSCRKILKKLIHSDFIVKAFLPIRNYDLPYTMEPVSVVLPSEFQNLLHNVNILSDQCIYVLLL
jgi:hypothetical protein